MDERSSTGADERAYAGLLERLCAYAVDCAILFGGLLIWQGALAPANPILRQMRRGERPTGARLHRWVFATATLPFLLYFAATQGAARRATLGMRLVGLEVVTTGGARLGFRRAMLRCAVLLIPFELNHAVLFHLLPPDGPPTRAFALGQAGVWAAIAAYLAAIPLTPHRQSVHDLAAGTVVRHSPHHARRLAFPRLRGLRRSAS